MRINLKRTLLTSVIALTILGAGGASMRLVNRPQTVQASESKSDMKKARRTNFRKLAKTPNETLAVLVTKRGLPVMNVKTGKITKIPKGQVVDDIVTPNGKESYIDYKNHFYVINSMSKKQVLMKKGKGGLFNPRVMKSDLSSIKMAAKRGLVEKVSGVHKGGIVGKKIGPNQAVKALLGEPVKTAKHAHGKAGSMKPKTKTVRVPKTKVVHKDGKTKRVPVPGRTVTKRVPEGEDSGDASTPSANSQENKSHNLPRTSDKTPKLAMASVGGVAIAVLAGSIYYLKPKKKHQD